MNIANSYDMFISSPNDVKEEEEIDAIKETVDKFNRRYRNSRTRILTVRWKSDIFLPTGTEPQESINEMLDTCDFVVAVFRSKLGKKRKNYPSGTAEEILTSKKAGKQVFVFYLENPPINPNKEFEKLKKFLKTLHGENIITIPYTDCDNLKDLLSNQLDLYYKKKLREKETLLQAAEEMKRRGITCVETGNAPDAILREKISKAKCVKVLATNAATFHRVYFDSLADMLRNGGDLKLLLANPHSEFLNDVQEIENRYQGMDSIHKGFSDVMGHLKMCLEDSGNQGTIHIGCSYSLLRQTEIICINQNDEIWAWVTMTMPPLRASSNSLSFGAEGNKDSSREMLAYQANYHFDKLWELAEQRKNIIEFDKDNPPTCFYEEKK